MQVAKLHTDQWDVQCHSKRTDVLLMSESNLIFLSPLEDKLLQFICIHRLNPMSPEKIQSQSHTWSAAYKHKGLISSELKQQLSYLAAHRL